MKRDAGRLAGLSLALLPALMFAIYLLRNSEFVFIDDASTLAKSHWPAGAFLESNGGGRYQPAYYLFTWAVFHLLPREPWALTSVNGLCLLVTCGAWYLLLDGMGQRFAGVMTAWLTALNAAAAAAYFHMSMPEILLTAAWSVSLLLMAGDWTIRPAAQGRMLWLRACGVFAAAAVTLLAKETGVLLAICSALWLVELLRRKRTPGIAPALTAAIAITLLGGALAVRHLLFGLRPGSYGGDVIFAATGRQGALPALFGKTWLIPVTLLLALPAGGAVAWRSAEPGRWMLRALLLQLGALTALYLLQGTVRTYYFQPALPCAGALLFLALAAAAKRIGRAAAAGIALLLAALHAWQAVLVISALTAWNWQCGNLTRLVRRGRPARVWFFRTGYWEYQMQATMLWQARYGLPTVAGRLEWPGDPPDGLSPSGILPSGLQAGDWIVAGWQAPANRTFPVGNIAWGMVGDGLDDPPEWRALDVEKIADWRDSFPAFSELPGRVPEGHLIWKVYRVRHPFPR
jgi:hypothetical protein